MYPSHHPLSPPGHAPTFDRDHENRHPPSSFQRVELPANSRTFSDHFRPSFPDYTWVTPPWFSYTNAPNSDPAIARTFHQPSSTVVRSMFPSHESAGPANAFDLQGSRREAVGGNFKAPYPTSVPPAGPSLQPDDVPAAHYLPAANMSASGMVDGWWPARVPEASHSQFRPCLTTHSPSTLHLIPSGSSRDHHPNFFPTSPAQANFTPSSSVSGGPARSLAHLGSPLQWENIQASSAAMPSGSPDCPLEKHTPNSLCDVPLSNDIKEVRAHLKYHHGFYTVGKDSVPCIWTGCQQSLQRENIPRHIISQHLKAKVKCVCGKTFCRQDVKMKHIKDNKCPGRVRK
ncbi:hypothetical protein F5I97DRAFT_700812 [Phlebopus sp. FC_14]|nr:hypothetical protein F5I97DRAFT_700812 [Phlebopus sp. FC_14]